MPKKRCIDRVVKASGDKKITKQQAEEILREIEAQIHKREGVEPKFASLEAAQSAMNDVIDKLEAKKVIDKRRRLKAIASDRDFFRRAEGFENKADALLSSIGKFGRTEADVLGGRNSVEGHFVALTAAYQGRLEARLHKEGLWADFKSNRLEREIANEMQQLSMGEKGNPGVSGSNAAKRIAAEVHSIMRDLVGKQNENGADIRMRADYILPQTHDHTVLRSLGGKETSLALWKKDILEGIDSEATFKGADEDAFLNSVHEDLYNNFFDEVRVDEFAKGKVDRVVLPKAGQHGSLAKKLGAERVLHFKDADSWFNYNKKYGRHKFLAQAIMGDIETRARSIALMSEFTHNPGEAFERRLRGLMALVKDKSDSARQLDAFRGREGRQIDAAWNEVTGANASEGTNAFNTYMNGFKTLQSVSKLGGAALASLPDLFTSSAKLMATMSADGSGWGRGLEAAVRVIKEVPSAFKAVLGKGSGAAWARVNGVMSDSFSMGISERWGSAVTGVGRANEMFKAVTNAFFKLNLLGWWTDTIRVAAHNAHAAILGEFSKVDFGKLPRGMRADMIEAGITELEWDAMRRTAMQINEDGARMVAADTVSNGDYSAVLKERGLANTQANLRKVAQDVELKTRIYMDNLLEQSIPTPGMEERLIMRGYRHTDDYMAGLLGVLLQFKTHPITVYNKIVRRAYKKSGAAGVGEFLAKGGSARNNLMMMIGLTTVAGYLAGAAKDIMRGKTPKDAKNWKTWLDAASRGGGLGIFGDVLFREYDNHLSKASSVFVGPTVGGLVDPLASSVSAIAHDGDMDAAQASLYKAARDNTPFANLFYIKPLMDQLIWFNMNEFFSPGWGKRYKARMDDAGQEFIDLPVVGEFGNPSE